MNLFYLNCAIFTVYAATFASLFSNTFLEYGCLIGYLSFIWLHIREYKQNDKATELRSLIKELNKKHDTLKKIRGGK